MINCCGGTIDCPLRLVVPMITPGQGRFSGPTVYIGSSPALSSAMIAPRCANTGDNADVSFNHGYPATGGTRGALGRPVAAHRHRDARPARAAPPAATRDARPAQHE